MEQEKHMTQIDIFTQISLPLTLVYLPQSEQSKFSYSDLYQYFPQMGQANPKNQGSFLTWEITILATKCPHFDFAHSNNLLGV
jgi:hypothetical protein